MSDRLPGSSYENPIWYRRYRIYASGYIHGYEYVHDDYDGPDAPDNRAGYAPTIEEAKAEIDEFEPRCRRCKGEGWTEATDIFADGSYATGRQCPRCGGTGAEPA